MGTKDRISGWTIAGVILMVISIGFTIFASAYPYWQESRKERNTRIANVGLWELCFEDSGRGYPAPPQAKDASMKRYKGCTYVFDRDYRHIVHWIFPGWFIVVTSFVTLGLLLQPLSVILVFLYMIRVCSPHVEHILIGVTCLLNVLNGVLTMIAIILFGIKAGTDTEWMPSPESNFLSYSYGMCAFVPVFCFFAAMCYAIDYIRLHTQRLINARANVYAKGEFNNRF